MRRSAGRHRGGPGVFLALAAILLAALAGPGWGYESAGVALDIFADPAHEVSLKYVLGQDPVKLILSIRNEAGAPVVTERGYSQVELYNYIFVTDPAGVRRVLGQAETAHKMPPPFFINDKPWALAETLPAGWVRTVTIGDMRDFLPVMGSTPGWYTIEAHQPFQRFAAQGQDPGLGLLGLLDSPDNWNGTVKSKRLQIYLAPPKGAQLRVGVSDAAAAPPAPLPQVAVKVFKDAALGTLPPAEAWGKAIPVLSGTTAMDGQALWEEGALCLSQGGYTVLAAVGGKYLPSIVAATDPRWEKECTGLIQVDVAAQAGVPIGRFSLFALNSISLGTSAVVHGGAVGARAASPGPWLSAGSEVAFGTKAAVAPGVVVYGDSIDLGNKATVYDVYYNQLTGKGEVKGKKFTPLALPVAEPPPFKPSAPGGQNVAVATKKSMDLSPGAYKDVVVGTKATLRLAAGAYDFESLEVGTSAVIICLGKTEIRVRGRFLAGTSAVVGPASGFTPRDVVLYVGGINGGAGGIAASPRAVELGTKSSVAANIFAPNGTLAVGTTAIFTGAVIAKDILLGTSAEVRHDSAF